MSSESENASESRAVADPSNVHWIRHYCTTYPDMKLVLSHSARGFQPEHNLEGLPQLADLPNLYFDSSINCEPTAHEAIIRIMGHDRLLYGTDYPCCHILGKYLALGDSFVVLGEDNPVWNVDYADITPALVGHEHLRSIKWACWAQGLRGSATLRSRTCSGTTPIVCSEGFCAGERRRPPMRGATYVVEQLSQSF